MMAGAAAAYLQIADTRSVTGRTTDWEGRYPDVASLDDTPEEQARRRAAAAAREAERAAWRKSRPAVELALDEFLETGQWPQRERFRRKLTQRGLDDLDPEEMLAVMPRSFWERNMAVPDRMILSLQALQELPKAEALLGLCMAMVQRAYQLYSSDTDDELKLRSDDPILLSAAGGTLVCCFAPSKCSTSILLAR
jgi:hypothetical protein